jgi:hypothetical protein
MKIVTTLITLLTLVVGTNIFIRVQDQDRLDTALILLDERISYTQTKVNSLEDYVADTTIDFEHMQYVMMDNIKDVATGIEKHEHEPVYIEKKEAPVVKITADIERLYDPETKLHVPNVATIPAPITFRCPKSKGNLGKFIENVDLHRDYNFIMTYDVFNNKISNVTFDKKLPSKLKSAMIKYVSSLDSFGTIADCKLSIKVLEN